MAQFHFFVSYLDPFIWCPIIMVRKILYFLSVHLSQVSNYSALIFKLCFHFFIYATYLNIFNFNLKNLISKISKLSLISILSQICVFQAVQPKGLVGQIFQLYKRKYSLKLLFVHACRHVPMGRVGKYLRSWLYGSGTSRPMMRLT